MAVWLFPVNEGSSMLNFDKHTRCIMKLLIRHRTNFYFQAVYFNNTSHFIQEYLSQQLYIHIRRIWTMMLRKECFECWAILLNAEGSLHDAAAVTMEATFRTLYRPVVKDPKTLCPMCLSLLYIIYWQLVCQLAVDRNQWAPPPPFFFSFFGCCMIMFYCFSNGQMCTIHTFPSKMSGN